MKKTLSLVIFILLLFGSCTPPQFTQENIMRLRVGMSDKDVISIFGLPNRTEAASCGGAYGKPWTCITWYYGDWSPKLTFQMMDDGQLRLNDWNTR